MAKRIGIIGAGNIGEAIIKGLLSSGWRNISASDVSGERLLFLKRNYKIKAAQSNIDLTKESDIIILAVKPHQIDGLLREISAALNQKKLVISIAAGIMTSRMEKAAGGKISVVRSMPNMPALIGKGICAVCPGRFAKKNDIRLAIKILSSVGKVVEVKEDMMDVVTAVSGSGPAYFFYLMQTLTEAAVKNGLSQKAAKELVAQTAFGAASLILETKQDPAALRQKVASKGGTTEAAFSVFQKEGLDEVIKKGIKAAIKRSEELSCL